MDLGRQCAYTGIRSLPIEGHVKEKLLSLCFFYQIVYKEQTITKLAENGRKGFRALYVMDIEVAKHTMVENGRKGDQEIVAEKWPEKYGAYHVIY